MRLYRQIALSFAAALTLALGGAGAILAQEAGDVEIDSPIRGVEVEPDRSRIDLDVLLFNRSTVQRPVQFELEGVPDGWQVAVWDERFEYRIDGYIVEPTEADPDRAQAVNLRIEPPGDPEPGHYPFTLRVLSEDGSIVYEEADYSVTVRDDIEIGEEADGGVTVRADAPVLQGPPGEIMGFEIIVGNESEEEASFNLSAEAPGGWTVEFVEPAGEMRTIGAVSVEAGVTERVTVDVTPPPDAELGIYEIPVTVSGEVGEASVVLEAELSGEGALEVSPQSELTAEARPGQSTTANVFLHNPGTGDLSDIHLTADAPDKWEVEFGHPDDIISSLPRNNEIVVPVTITSPGDTVPGDYIVAVQAEHDAMNVRPEMRVTITESTVWNWVGLALVVVVVGGMIGLFMRLARR